MGQIDVLEKESDRKSLQGETIGCIVLYMNKARAKYEAWVSEVLAILQAQGVDIKASIVCDEVLHRLYTDLKGKNAAKAAHSIICAG